MDDAILVINAGSSSVKFELFALRPDGLASTLEGQLDGIGTKPRLKARRAGGETVVDRALDPAEAPDVHGSIRPLAAWLPDQLAGSRLVAVGHRVVHGGAEHARPLLVDDAVLDELDRLSPLAPLHQPNNLAVIRAIRASQPALPQVACFDTAFHRSHDALADRYAIPEALHAEGVRRYGFHGLSYEYIASVLPAQAPRLAAGRTVVAHLGSGASLCALEAGRSAYCTMGFTALDGLPMGTRSGQIDPGVLLYLMDRKGWDARRLERFLYHECGLLGLSGLSNDMRELLASDAEDSRRAIGYFVQRVAMGVGELAAAMGGIDGIVFTAGIGERAAFIRAAVCRKLAWLGVDLDEPANADHGPRISTEASRLQAWVIPTDEELMIARHTAGLLGLAA
ncbi:MAG: acetate/propionate family kinase [Geminicoccaceae bacterium]